mmetsp:Transcript_1685/g.3949  ORF Transcript_1685/g.3949 Transcript_1685/m.3949 type:complete len:265 (+) Transcript_1685:54-848(+)|eukprot:CAMPEP_0170600100 /NCGR_PEP_ID=MMETSP0224-20130122/17157_1 /TAXON_ID=285029 /ORGANISM="Togula jolla, Strain CCCM 725" /LENGTH=264 /DNA_ID=CAMNT_0010924809 /DNA_START=54 /DNA_END=851 /DNA_ORIENTATION=-
MWAALSEVLPIPIVRGQCDACGFSRNIWASEMGEVNGELKCDHRNRGCTGHLHIAYMGTKGSMPEELDWGGWSCKCDENPQRGSGEQSSACSSGRPHDHAGSACAASSGQAAQQPSRKRGLEEQEQDECPICIEPLAPSDAAMRCSGEAGKRHIYHASCLTAWIRQCRADGVAPSCPQCRGSLQVQPGRIRQFLQGNRTQLSQEDTEVLEAMHDAAEESESDGWSSIRSDMLWKGAAVVAGAAVVGLLAATLMNRQRERRQRED